MTRIALRTIAGVIAVLGIIDPSYVTSRPRPAPVRLQIVEPAGLEPLAGGGTTRRQRAEAVTKRLTGELGSLIDVSGQRAPAAVVLIGSAPPEALPAEDVPVSTVSLTEWLSPNVRLVRVDEPVAAPFRHAAAIDAEFEAIGMNGRSSAIAVSDGGVIVARTEHRWSQDRERFRARLHYAPPAAGPRIVTIAAQALDEERTATDNGAEVAVMVDDRPLRVLAYEPRPSWNATFVRRALEADPRFRVETIARSSRGVFVRSGAARALAADLDDFDVAVVGAPEELRQSELDVLSRFARERGGGVVFLPDRRPSGPYVDVLPAGGFEETLTENPVRLVMDVSHGVRASELLVARSSAPAVAALAAVERSGRRVPVALTWTQGGGRLIFWGALDAWRYRADSADGFARFWQATVADLALAAPPRVMVEAAPRIAAPNEPILIRATVRPTEFARRPDRLEIPPVGAMLVSEAGASQPVRLWPTPEVGVFEGRTATAVAGRYAVRVAAGPHGGRAPVIVVAARRKAVEEDAGAMKLIAESTGGVAVGADNLAALEGHLRSLAGASERMPVRPMRSRWWALAFAAGLCAEWALRRRKGLT